MPEQSLTSATDDAVIEACRAEGRALVSLDLDLANPLRFLPERYPGIAVLRPPPRVSAVALAYGLPARSAGAIFLLGRISGWVAHVQQQRLAGFLLRPRAKYVP